MGIDSEAREELVILYKIAIDDIRDGKHQQWRIIQLTLLAIAALTSVKNYFPNLPLSCLVVFVALVGVFFIAQFTYSLERFRRKKETIQEKFNSITREIDNNYLFSNKEREEKLRKRFQHVLVFASAFSFFIFIAAAMSIFIIYTNPSHSVQGRC